jgi:rhodanese-related sulfurtransferase
MPPFPLHLESLVGQYGSYLVFLLIGVAFGYTLEIAGFGNSIKLANQFYLKDMTVLKVMFTAIVVAMVLIFGASALGLLDVNLIWVNPTYLVPGIVGGLIMGVGFIVGGFCPGTSLVAASTLKVDGVFFVLGVGTGVWLFGESVDSFLGFFNSSFMGRFTVSDWLGIPTGVVLVLLVLMALGMFFGGEIAERVFGQGERWGFSLVPTNKWKIGGAAAILAVAVVVAIKGQPTLTQRWARMSAQEEAKLDQRDVYVHPGEVADLMANAGMAVSILDVRAEQDFNLFHLANAHRVDPAEVASPAFLSALKQAAEGTVFFLVSNDERDATAAYKTLRSAGAMNLYIVEGGINGWLDAFGIDPCVATPLPKGAIETEQLRYAFARAIGEKTAAAHPGCPCKELPVACDRPATELAEGHEHAAKPAYTPKVKLQKKSKPHGGCG